MATVVAANISELCDVITIAMTKESLIKMEIHMPLSRGFTDFRGGKSHVAVIDYDALGSG